MSHEYKFTQEEELIFRELEALSGDCKQLADNLVRHHKEREEQALRVAEQKERGGVSLPMMVMNLPGILTDLGYLRDRLCLMIDYLNASTKPGRSA